MNKEQKRKLYVLGLPIILGTILLCGVSYAWLSLTLTGTKTNVLKAGTLSLILDESMGNGINLTGAVPMLDAVGLATTPYEFRLRNTGDVHSEYQIYLDDIAIEEGKQRLSDESIRFSLNRNDATIKTGLLSELENRLLDSGLITGGEEIKYELRMWLDKDATVEEAGGRVFKGKLRVEGSQIIETNEETSSSCFTFNSSTGTITGYSSSCPKDVKIPEKISGVTVKEIGIDAFRNKGLTSVKNPSTVTQISNRAFNNNQLPDNQAFIYKRNSDGSEDRTTIVGYEGARKENIQIPNGVTTIEYSAFQFNELKSVIIPDTVTTIGSRAFAVNQLTHIEIPSSVTSLGGGAFANNQLPDEEAFIYARKSDGSIDNTTLNSYAGVSKDILTVPAGIKVLDSLCFHNTKAKEIILPEGLTTIGASVFENVGLTNINIPSTVTSIAGGAFRFNNLPEEKAYIYARRSDGSEDKTTLVSYGGSKREVVIPEGVTTLASSALGWQNLTSITLPNSLITIKSYAFDHNNLTTITIPANVTTIGTGVLTGNDGLETIVNKTGRSFDWRTIAGGNAEATFVTGIISRPNGNITVIN